MAGTRGRAVYQAINNAKVVIFSKSTCPNCLEIKKKFKTINSGYRAIEIDTRKDAPEIWNKLFKLTGAKSVPQVFINGKYAGDGEKIRKMFEDKSIRNLIYKGK